MCCLCAVGSIAMVPPRRAHRRGSRFAPCRSMRSWRCVRLVCALGRALVGWLRFGPSGSEMSKSDSEKGVNDGWKSWTAQLPKEDVCTRRRTSTLSALVVHGSPRDFGRYDRRFARRRARGVGGFGRRMSGTKATIRIAGDNRIALRAFAVRFWSSIPSGWLRRSETFCVRQRIRISRSVLSGCGSFQNRLPTQLSSPMMSPTISGILLQR